jgi:hypothetical protein
MALFGRLGLIILSPFVLQFQFARFLWARFKFHMFPHPIHQLAQTRTHFALYLRSFIDDDISAKETVESFGDNPIRYARSLATKLTVQDRVEKILGDRLRPHIPVLCIGRPGERYPISSFGRLFVEDASWKEVVRALIEMSQLVIARVGATPGFQWELEILCKQEMMQKTVLVFCTKFGFPFSPREVREAMAALHIDISDVAIPTETYFCVFDNNGKPTLLLAPYWQGYPNAYLRLRENSRYLFKYLAKHLPSIFPNYGTLQKLKDFRVTEPHDFDPTTDRVRRVEMEHRVSSATSWGWIASAVSIIVLLALIFVGGGGQQ